MICWMSHASRALSRAHFETLVVFAIWSRKQAYEYSTLHPDTAQPPTYLQATTQHPAMSSNPPESDSPFPPRTLAREEATNNLLKAHSVQTQQDNQPFAAAVEAHQNTLLSSSPIPKCSHRERWQQLHNTPPSAGPNGRLMPQNSTDSQTSVFSRASDFSQTSTVLDEAKAEYARHMAESTLTRNGRELMGKATTTTSRWHVVWYSSAHTRGLGEMLREVLEVRYPPVG